MANFSSTKTIQNERVRAYNGGKNREEHSTKTTIKTISGESIAHANRICLRRTKANVLFDIFHRRRRRKKNINKTIKSNVSWLLTGTFAHATLRSIARRRDTRMLIKKIWKVNKSPSCVRHITKKPRKLIDWFLLKCFVILFCHWQCILFYSSLRFTRFPASFSLCHLCTVDANGLWAQHAALFSAILLLHWMKSSDNLIVAFLFVCIKLNIIDWQSLVKCISNKQKKLLHELSIESGKKRSGCFVFTQRSNVCYLSRWQQTLRRLFLPKKKEEAEEEQFDELDNEWWLISRAKAKPNNWGKLIKLGNLLSSLKWAERMKSRQTISVCFFILCTFFSFITFDKGQCLHMNTYAPTIMLDFGKTKRQN